MTPDKWVICFTTIAILTLIEQLFINYLSAPEERLSFVENLFIYVLVVFTFTVAAIFAHRVSLIVKDLFLVNWNG